MAPPAHLQRFDRLIDALVDAVVLELDGEQNTNEKAEPGIPETPPKDHARGILQQHNEAA